MLQKTTVPGIYRDDSGALINTDNNALLSYKAKKEQSKRIVELEKKMNNINSELCDIKEMLVKLLNKQD